MAIGQWFNEGAAARSAGEQRTSCCYQDGEARSEWLAGFDEATAFEIAIGAFAAGRSEPSVGITNHGVHVR